ncbi:uncharacterized protein LOC142345817 [Convolutriloba macropyga]|uniref:uncharacterized protein LOC142345817 n=1 Tax=Convolutriloba macropyga TaxID=536237 RepID=UPI003F51DE7F
METRSFFNWALFIGLVALLCGDVHGEEGDVESGTFFCVNCGGDVSSCCEGVMGLPFCCSPELHTVQTGISVVNKVFDVAGYGLNKVLTCQSNEDCPALANQVIGLIDDDANGDYCCPIANVCCQFGDYFEMSFKTLSYSFGGPVIFIGLLLLLSIGACCCCCYCCGCCRGRQRSGNSQQGPAIILTGVAANHQPSPQYSKLQG